MTRLSPKPNSHHDTNGRGSHSQNLPIEAQTYSSDYPPSMPYRMPAASDQSLPKLASLEAMGKTPEQRSNGRGLLSSLRSKAIGLALAIGTLPVLAVGATAYFTASGGMYDQVVSNEQTNTLDLEDKLDGFMAERYSDIQVMAELPVLNNAEIAKITPKEEKERLLNAYEKLYESYDSIGVFDLQGNVIAQSDSGEILENHSDRDYFQEVLKTNQVYITEPRLSETTNRYGIYITAPIKDSVTGKTIGVIRTREPMERVNGIFGVTQDRQQEFHLIDSSGNVVAADDPNDIGETFEEKFPTMYSKVQQNQEEVLTIVEQRTGREDVITYSPTEELAERYNLHWALIIVRPTEVAFAPQRNMLWTLGLGTGGAALMVGAIAAFVANTATRPIVDAAGAVAKIGQGDLDTRLQVKGDDELAALGANINDMAAQLEVFIQEQELAAEQARLLADITGSRTLKSQEIRDLFQKAVEETRKILNAERVMIFRFNPDGSSYVAAESVAMGWPRSLNDKIEELTLSEEQRKVYKDARVVATNHVFETDLAPEQQKLMARLGVKANLEVPILHEGEPYGLIMAHQCSVPREWQTAEVNFFKQLGGQIGLVIDRVMLMETTDKLAQEQRELKEGLQKRALELLKEVDPISKGDLTIRARVTADEIGTIADSYNATVGNLRKIVEQVQDAATQVATTTSSNEVAVQSLSHEALRQAEQISSALSRAQEMAETVRMVASHAEQAELAVREASQTVAEGDNNMNRTVEGILAIRETVAETAKKVKHLGESSQKISTVVNLISTFAAQTNLLALNASIEAARAGEEGRGFAVVADEVRALARQSAEATAEIEKLVAAIQGETNEVVAAMEAGTEQVVTGTKLVDETRASLNKIATASNQINQLVEAIAEATVIQSKASEDVTQTMTDVAQIAARTSEEAGFVSSSFEQLRKVAQTLQSDVGKFKLN
ncbi:MAG: methyl-accepting chemotaxis protein [Coleofasciculus sp. G3-WIS-01]|uniref:methyl-accepting chemotaxis protein n=1 Tax=Coleofasciculus sp. G3-WIS-01 TaxID=3069528 RepID=UPI0032FD3217